MNILNLRPLSQGEIESEKEDFIDRVCAGKFEMPSTKYAEDREKLFARMLTGGYPEAVQRKTVSRRNAWFNSYITTLLQRDVRDLANIEGLIDFPKLLTILAARATFELRGSFARRRFAANDAEKIHRAARKSVFDRVSAGVFGKFDQANDEKPETIFTDTGLLSYLQNLTWEKIKFEPPLAGLLPENFAVAGLKKPTRLEQSASADASFSHFDQSGS